MRGLAIAYDFWLSWGQPFLQEHFPDLAPCVAAGRLLGSDVLGGDDHISRDHDWGPQFSLFLSKQDYTQYGLQLTQQMNAAAPNPWKGYRLNGGGDKSVNVECIPDWFSSFLGLSSPPQTVEQWAITQQDPSRESVLYFVKHGAVWTDGSGELSQWREALAQYPPHLYFKRLAQECFRVWHYGEYNFVQRVRYRRDPLTIPICLGEFVSGVMRLVMLLEGDFTPYWKWLAFEFRKVQQASAYIPLLEQLTTSHRVDEQAEVIVVLSKLLHEQLLAAEVVTGQAANPGLLPLLTDHFELGAKAEALTGST
jgi:hypothetical protein